MWEAVGVCIPYIEHLPLFTQKLTKLVLDFCNGRLPDTFLFNPVQ